MFIDARLLKTAAAAIAVSALLAAPALACEKNKHGEMQQSRVEPAAGNAQSIRVADASGHTVPATSETVRIDNAWTRVTPPGAKVAGGFLTVTNTGSEPDRLVGASFPLSERVEVHEMSMTDGVMRMQEVKGGIEIAPGGTVELKPGGYHLMFMGLSASPKEGEPLTGSVEFEKAGKVTVTFQVAPLGAKSIDGKGGDMSGGHGHGDHGKSDAMDHGKGHGHH